MGRLGTLEVEGALILDLQQQRRTLAIGVVGYGSIEPALMRVLLPAVLLRKQIECPETRIVGLGADDSLTAQ